MSNWLRILILITSLLAVSMAADCFCKNLPPIYTEDCCLGTFGELRNDFGTHCIFQNYTNLGDFNRCCDSYFGMARCVLSPR
ncbi:hypothetical protein BJV82DRAFT_620096 [Fennellomyces sp. T-0311]|nr:hypothetical protein BJV82DRAFT_620096 [Fennellomyces sp. T-0311]